MDAGFDENEAEFRVLVFAITLEMLADGDGLVSVSASLYLDRTNQKEWTDDATFLINMYRSSGISGARPVMQKSLRQS